jgi:hypothetical protein
MLSKEQEVQGSDTTKMIKDSTAGNKKILRFLANQKLIEQLCYNTNSLP